MAVGSVLARSEQSIYRCGVLVCLSGLPLSQPQWTVDSGQWRRRERRVSGAQECDCNVFMLDSKWRNQSFNLSI